MAGKMNGTAPRARSHSTTVRATRAMRSIPRLPRPTATSHPSQSSPASAESRDATSWAGSESGCAARGWATRNWRGNVSMVTLYSLAGGCARAPTTVRLFDRSGRLHSARGRVRLEPGRQGRLFGPSEPDACIGMLQLLLQRHLRAFNRVRGKKRAGIVAQCRVAHRAGRVHDGRGAQGTAPRLDLGQV